MTSPGLKRPLDYEFAQQHTTIKNDSSISESDINEVDNVVSKEIKHQQVGDNIIGSSSGGGGVGNESLKIEEIGEQQISPRSDGSVGTTNGNKRRCTTTNFHHNNNHNAHNVHNNLDIEPKCIPLTATTTTVASVSPQTTRSPSRDSHHQPLNDDIDALIRDELYKSLPQHDVVVVDGKNNNQSHNANGNVFVNEPPILTARQTQNICEKLIKERERKLRDEYDRKLACKLAEQYDLFAKAKYLDSLVEQSTRTTTPTTSPIPTATQQTTPTAAAPAATNHPSITNAIAAAFMQQRTAAANSIVSTAPNVTVAGAVTCTAQNLPNLSNLAASLSAATNGHGHGHGHVHGQGAMQSQHLTAFNMRHQAAAATVALRQAHSVQQHQLQITQPNHHQHHNHHHQLPHPITGQQSMHQHQHQQQLRGSVCLNNNNNNNVLPLGPVLLASSLDEQLATPEALFTLFGVFGDVIRVKILFNKKDNALIQMADANQAQVAQSYLDKQKIYGKVIRVTRSKHQLVQMPREGNQTDAGLTKDFTNSSLHRFKIPGSRNYLNIYPPSHTLHISNIPVTVEEEGLYRAFKEQCGFEFSTFKFFPKDKKMALMKFDSIEHATIALIRMHNFQISDEHNLRVSFSKSSI